MRLFVVSLCVGLISLTAPQAAADIIDGVYAEPSQEDGTTTVSVGSDGSVPQSGSSGGGSGVTCNYYDTFNTETDALQFAPNPGSFEDGLFYWVECFDADGNRLFARYFQFSPSEPPVSPYRLALAARTTLELAFPEPRTNPDRTVDQLVGIDTWLWIDPASWRPLTASVSIPGIGATVTAAPVRVTWDMGDGQAPVVCEGPGTPYDTDLPEAAQTTDCSHLYQDRGAYTATATLTWEITWSATNGEGGSLEPASRSTQFPMSVSERQAIGT